MTTARHLDLKDLEACISVAFFVDVQNVQTLVERQEALLEQQQQQTSSSSSSSVPSSSSSSSFASSPSSCVAVLDIALIASAFHVRLAALKIASILANTANAAANTASASATAAGSSSSSSSSSGGGGSGGEGGSSSTAATATTTTTQGAKFRTRAVWVEIMYALCSSGKIQEATRLFGVSASTQVCVCVCFVFENVCVCVSVNVNVRACIFVCVSFYASSTNDHINFYTHIHKTHTITNHARTPHTARVRCRYKPE